MASSSCFPIVANIGNGGLFRLQDQRDQYFVSQYSGLAVMMPDNVEDLNQQLRYNPTTLQIYNPATNLCLDDQGGEALGRYNPNANILFAPCNVKNPNQQFIYKNSRIYNPNWPNNNACFNRDGNIHPGTSYRELMLWNSDAINPDEDFLILLICGPGKLFVVVIKVMSSSS